MCFKPKYLLPFLIHTCFCVSIGSNETKFIIWWIGFIHDDLIWFLCTINFIANFVYDDFSHSFLNWKWIPSGNQILYSIHCFHCNICIENNQMDLEIFISFKCCEIVNIFDSLPEKIPPLVHRNDEAPEKLPDDAEQEFPTQ